MNTLQTDFDTNTKKKTSEYFSEIVGEQARTESSQEYIKQNTEKILALLGKQSDAPLEVFWEEFHENYRHIPDLLPERGVFR